MYSRWSRARVFSKGRKRFYQGEKAVSEPLIRLPGYVSNYPLSSRIGQSKNFTWGEATHGGQRVPQSKEHVQNILRLASGLQVAREQIQRPFHITSWYRPEPWNTQAGGVPNSMHLSGRAVDFWVPGMTGAEVAEQLYWWEGGLGTYRNYPALVHLDIGLKRRW